MSQNTDKNSKKQLDLGQKIMASTQLSDDVTGGYN